MTEAETVQDAEAEISLGEEHLAEALSADVTSVPAGSANSPTVEPVTPGVAPPGIEVGGAPPGILLASAVPFRQFRAADGTVVPFGGVKVDATLAAVIEQEAASCGFVLRKV